MPSGPITKGKQADSQCWATKGKQADSQCWAKFTHEIESPTASLHSLIVVKGPCESTEWLAFACAIDDYDSMCGSVKEVSFTLAGCEGIMTKAMMAVVSRMVGAQAFPQSEQQPGGQCACP